MLECASNYAKIESVEKMNLHNDHLTKTSDYATQTLSEGNVIIHK